MIAFHQGAKPGVRHAPPRPNAWAWGWAWRAWAVPVWWNKPWTRCLWNSWLCRLTGGWADVWHLIISWPSLSYNISTRYHTLYSYFLQLMRGWKKEISLGEFGPLDHFTNLKDHWNPPTIWAPKMQREREWESTKQREQCWQRASGGYIIILRGEGWRGICQISPDTQVGVPCGGPHLLLAAWLSWLQPLWWR